MKFGLQITRTEHPTRITVPYARYCTWGWGGGVAFKVIWTMRSLYRILGPVNRHLIFFRSCPNSFEVVDLGLNRHKCLCLKGLGSWGTQRRGGPKPLSFKGLERHRNPLFDLALHCKVCSMRTKSAIIVFIADMPTN